MNFRLFNCCISWIYFYKYKISLVSCCRDLLLSGSWTQDLHVVFSCQVQLYGFACQSLDLYFQSYVHCCCLSMLPFYLPVLFVSECCDADCIRGFKFPMPAQDVCNSSCTDGNQSPCNLMEEEKPVLHGVNIRAATPDRLIHLCVESFGMLDYHWTLYLTSSLKVWCHQFKQYIVHNLVWILHN